MIEQHLYEELCADVLPLLRRIPATEKYVIALGGSHGKGLSDRRSDFDFRLYYESRIEGATWDTAVRELHAYMDKWKARGVEIDGAWPRSFGEIDTALDQWLSGAGSAVPMEWSVWGYNILTDIFNQVIIEDPFKIAQAWKDRLSIYPDALRNSIIKKNGDSLKYWRTDYHYYSKCLRRDCIFMASISARLVHDIMQVLYALNRFYFPGDGHNLSFTNKFSVKPEKLEERIARILYPGDGTDCLDRQYSDTVLLIDDVLGLLTEYASIINVAYEISHESE